jgi:hypothetical protein
VTPERYWWCCEGFTVRTIVHDSPSQCIAKVRWLVRVATVPTAHASAGDTATMSSTPNGARRPAGLGAAKRVHEPSQCRIRAHSTKSLPTGASYFPTAQMSEGPVPAMALSSLHSPAPGVVRHEAPLNRVGGSLNRQARCQATSGRASG